MANKLCKLSKNKIDKDYLEKCNEPKVICTKCGRTANKKSFVCKPMRIDEF